MVRIPVEYQEVEYLESSGTQWINTRIPLNTIADEQTNWNLQFSPTSVSKTRILCGANESEKQVVLLSSGVIRKDWAIPGRTGFSKTLLVGGIYLISQTNGLFKLQSTEEDAETEQITRTTSSNYPFALFAKTTNENGTTVENTTIAFIRLYNFNAFNDNSGICNFIPCYRKSDNEPGMYDTVSGTFFTNAGTGEFIVGNDVSWDTASLIERRRQILLNTPHLATASANPLTFQTDISANLKECKIYFYPKQEGSGDPSPDNVRPITGWDGVTVYKTGKNLLIKDEITFTGSSYINRDGNIASSRYYKRSGSIPCSHIAGKTVTFNTVIAGSGSSVTSVGFYSSDTIDSDHAVLLTRKNQESDETITVTVPLTAKYMVITLNSAYTLDGKYIVEGTEPLNEVDTPTAITIPFPQTIYGGYVDLVNGEVVEKWSQIASYNSETLPGEWMSDRDVYTAGTSPTIGAQVAYKLATPITYQLTPETIQTLKGTNNILSNANGNIEVKFWKH